MSLLEQTEQELRDIADANLKENGVRGELANELLTRLNEKNADYQLISRKERVENALGLLQVLAFTVTQKDVSNILGDLSDVCTDWIEFRDVLFIDQATERKYYLTQSSPVLSDIERRFRNEYKELLARLEISGDDDDLGIDPAPPTNNDPRMG
jgi:hypothetical protein